MAQLRRGEEYSQHCTKHGFSLSLRLQGWMASLPSAKKKTYNKQEAKLSGHTLTVAQDNNALRKHP
jgi:hypothetical protein